VPSQHAPAHTRPPEQLELHLCVDGLHAVPEGQSLGPLHPQEPFGWQTAPPLLVEQIVHVVLPVPQLAFAVPGEHVFVLGSQQPPLQRAAPQLLEHACVVGSHAW
jgi:hypothetical protein